MGELGVNDGLPSSKSHLSPEKKEPTSAEKRDKLVAQIFQKVYPRDLIGTDTAINLKFEAFKEHLSKLDDKQLSQLKTNLSSITKAAFQASDAVRKSFDQFLNARSLTTPSSSKAEKVPEESSKVEITYVLNTGERVTTLPPDLKPSKALPASATTLPREPKAGTGQKAPARESSVPKRETDVRTANVGSKTTSSKPVPLLDQGKALLKKLNASPSASPDATAGLGMALEGNFGKAKAVKSFLNEAKNQFKSIADKELLRGIVDCIIIRDLKLEDDDVNEELRNLKNEVNQRLTEEGATHDKGIQAIKNFIQINKEFEFLNRIQDLR